MILIYGQTSPMEVNSLNQFSLEGSAGVFSNGLPVSFINKFIFGGAISSDNKNNASNRLSKSNSLALEASSRLSYLSKPSTIFGIKNGFWGAEIGTQAYSYNLYSEDLFKLAFYGNGNFIDQNLDLAKSSSQTFSYHHIGVKGGIKWNNIGKFKSIQIIATPAFVWGVAHQELHLERGNFLTRVNGEFIDVDFSGNYSTNDSLYESSGPRGYGAKIELNLLLVSSKNKIGLSITDLGFISWQNQINYDLDTSFTFSGIEIDDVFNIQDTLLSVAQVQDSTFTSSEKKFTQNIPMLISVYFEHAFTKKLYLKNWLQHRFVAHYIPFVMSQINYKTHGFSGGVSIAYGGYSSIQAGLQLGYDFKSADFILGSTNLLGFISQKNQSVENIYGKLIVKF